MNAKVVRVILKIAFETVNANQGELISFSDPALKNDGMKPLPFPYIWTENSTIQESPKNPQRQMEGIFTESGKGEIITFTEKSTLDR